jgi:protein KRI1
MDGEDLGNSDDNEMDAGLLSDTSFESLASRFEASYNHRFEEPGAATIASFPRILPSVVRRQDTTRKEARERRKERKEEELRKRQEEVKRMKALKMREIRRKLERVGREAGLKRISRGDNDDDEFVDEALKEFDLEGEWDPEKHDRQMAELFDRDAEVGEDDDAWAGEFGDDGELDSDGKPKWDDDIDIGGIALPDDALHGDSRKSKKEKKKKKKKKKKGDEDEDGAVDIDAIDAEHQQSDEEWDGTEEMRKRKLNEYMDEVYGLDFNDIVGCFYFYFFWPILTCYISGWRRLYTIQICSRSISRLRPHASRDPASNGSRAQPIRECEKICSLSTRQRRPIPVEQERSRETTRTQIHDQKSSWKCVWDEVDGWRPG